MLHGKAIIASKNKWEGALDSRPPGGTVKIFMKHAKLWVTFYRKLAYHEEEAKPGFSLKNKWG